MRCGRRDDLDLDRKLVRIHLKISREGKVNFMEKMFDEEKNKFSAGK